MAGMPLPARGASPVEGQRRAICVTKEATWAGVLTHCATCMDLQKANLEEQGLPLRELSVMV